MDQSRNSDTVYKRALPLLFAFICLLCGCEKKTEPAPVSPLDAILNTGEIVMITRNNAQCYYQYRGQYMGFEYDLGRAFADYLGVRLRVRLADTWDRMTALLKETPGAFIAGGIAVTAERQARVAFSDAYLEVRPRLMTRQGTPGGLSGKTIRIPWETPCLYGLEALKQQGATLTIVSENGPDAEELIRQVAAGEIEATVVPGHIARQSRKYYPQVAMGAPIGQKIALAWAVRPRSQRLLRHINLFFGTVRQNGIFSEIYNKYYSDTQAVDSEDITAFHRQVTTALPPYLPLIRAAAGKYGFEWQLIAAQIYQESHFNPGARSKYGACGLMQITASVAGAGGVTDLFEPGQNIRAGVRHLRMLYDFFDQAQGEDRLRIALAAYNAGQGHILDARNLARSKGLDPEQWASLATTLPLLTRPRFYRESLYGYCRGEEPVKYVTRIMTYYDILRHRTARHENDAA